MARRVAVHFTMEVLGVEVGHWCNQCMLSSGIRVLYVNIAVPSMCFHTATACRDCEADDVELVDEPTMIWKSC